MRTTAGRSDRLVDPKAATPAGRPKTPAPTMLFTRENTMVGIDAPSVVVAGGTVEDDTGPYFVDVDFVVVVAVCDDKNKGGTI